MADDIHASGPLFDEAKTKAATRRMLQGVIDEVSAVASERVHFYLAAQLKHPTPYYETQINTQHVNRGPAVYSNSVNDRGVIYGPWLEGTSHRNESTRFKGYASFRKATTDTQRVAESVSAPAIVAFANDMNGR